MHDIHSKYSENETVAVQFQSAGTIETKSLKVEQEMRDIKSKNALFFNVFPFFFIQMYNTYQPGFIYCCIFGCVFRLLSCSCWLIELKVYRCQMFYVHDNPNLYHFYETWAWMFILDHQVHFITKSFIFTHIAFQSFQLHLMVFIQSVEMAQVSLCDLTELQSCGVCVSNPYLCQSNLET